MGLQIVARTGHPDFLDLEWDRPLAEWDPDRTVTVTRGISRHVVRFVMYPADTVYALKEIPVALAEREREMLSGMSRRSVPAVEPVGLVRGRRDARSGEELDAVLITRHLDFALPYRTVFERGPSPDTGARLMDALANLLVRLHLAGFLWGDCSLSNSLYRRDAGSLAAWLVDAETSEWHHKLTHGQRTWDLEIARENIAGELLDLEAGPGLPSDLDPIATADGLCDRYSSLWEELVHDETFGPHDRYRVEARLRRLNELGFDVRELELVTTADGYRLRIDPEVVEPDHHARRMAALTGLRVQENQARRLLTDIAAFRAHIERARAAPVGEKAAAGLWLAEVFEPALAAIPEDLHMTLEPAEIFHQVLDHRWLRSEAEGRDVPTVDAVNSFVEQVLRHRQPERTVVTDATDEPE